MKRLTRLVRAERGQGLTEYIVIAALIAIAAMGIVTVFGDNIRALFGASVDALAGVDSGVKGAKTRMRGTRADHRNIQNFASDVGR
jgi:Flp pilus assembly pilin Flp